MVSTSGFADVVVQYSPTARQYAVDAQSIDSTRAPDPGSVSAGADSFVIACARCAGAGGAAPAQGVIASTAEPSTPVPPMSETPVTPRVATSESAPGVTHVEGTVMSGACARAASAEPASASGYPEPVAKYAVVAVGKALLAICAEVS